MADKEKRITYLLNEASKSGLNVEGLRDVVTDYFTYDSDRVSCYGRPPDSFGFANRIQIFRFVFRLRTSLALATVPTNNHYNVCLTLLLTTLSLNIMSLGM